MNQFHTEHSTQQQQNTSSYQAHLNKTLPKLDHIPGHKANIKWFKGNVVIPRIFYGKKMKNDSNNLRKRENSKLYEN